MLADKVDHIIGVDTHKDSHTVAWSARLVGSSRTRPSPPTPSAPAAATGSQSSRRQDVGSGRSRAPAATAPASPPACSSRANGSSRSTVLPARRAATAKTDDLDAVRAAREALGRDHLAQPRRRGDREAIRVLRPPATARWGHGRARSTTSRRRSSTHRAPARVTARAGDRPTAGPGALACAATPPSRSSIAPPSSGCAAPPSARSPSKPRPTISKPSSTRSSVGPPRGCWPSRASG